MNNRYANSSPNERTEREYKGKNYQRITKQVKSGSFASKRVKRHTIVMKMDGDGKFLPVCEYETERFVK